MISEKLKRNIKVSLLIKNNEREIALFNFDRWGSKEDGKSVHSEGCIYEVRI
jgi:hypothetical protein